MYARTCVKGASIATDKCTYLKFHKNLQTSTKLNIKASGLTNSQKKVLYCVAANTTLYPPQNCLKRLTNIICPYMGV